jgi:hypothetical protein
VVSVATDRGKPITWCFHKAVRLSTNGYLDPEIANVAIYKLNRDIFSPLDGYPNGVRSYGFTSDVIDD